MSRWRYDELEEGRAQDRAERRARRAAKRGAGAGGGGGGAGASGAVPEAGSAPGPASGPSCGLSGDAPGGIQSASLLANVRAWLAEPLGEKALGQVRAIAAADDVKLVRVMPDAHAGELLCNGCVVATERLVYPKAVGGDIGCGFAVAPLGVDASLLRDPRRGAEVLHAIGRAVPIIRHAKAAIAEAMGERSVAGAAGIAPGLPAGELSAPALRSLARRDGIVELGTLGRGNHFIELGREAAGELWAIVHSGSRAMGPAILAHHLRHVPGAPSDRELGALDAAGEAGAAYLADAAWAIAYASASRLAMLRAVARVLPSAAAGVDALRLVDAPHNTITREAIGGVTLLVHRKGANAARKGAPVVVAGSAGTFSVIGEGRGCADSLDSCSHGAGRRWSRSEAGRRLGAGDVRSQMRGVVFEERLSARLVSEAPGAYRDLREVMAAQKELVREVVRLTPLLSFKGT